MAKDRSDSLVARVVAAFGGLKPMATACGHKHSTTVQGWRDADRIPEWRLPEVAQAAAGLKLRLPDEFVTVLHAKGIAYAAEPDWSGGPVGGAQGLGVAAAAAQPSAASQLEAIAAELGEFSEGDGGRGPIRPDVKPDEAA